MCRVYRRGTYVYTRLCARTGQPGRRIAGDARGPGGHVLRSRLPATAGASADRREKPAERTGRHDTGSGRRGRCELCKAPHRPLDAEQRCPECLLEIERGDRIDSKRPKEGDPVGKKKSMLEALQGPAEPEQPTKARSVTKRQCVICKIRFTPPEWDDEHEICRWCHERDRLADRHRREG